MAGTGAARRGRARKRAKADAYEEKLESLRGTVSGMEGVCRPLAEDLLEAYARVYADWHRLDEAIERDGYLIEGARGGTVKNPAFDMRRNCIAQMADLANKIKRFVRDDDGQAEDEFEAF